MYFTKIEAKTNFSTSYSNIGRAAVFAANYEMKGVISAACVPAV